MGKSVRKKRFYLPNVDKLHLFLFKGFSDSFTAYKIRIQNEFSMSKTFKLEDNRNEQ